MLAKDLHFLIILQLIIFFQQGGESLLVVRAVSGSYTTAKTLTAGGAGANNVIKSGSSDNLGPFSLATISKGTINNSESPVLNNVLTSGSGDNIRWEVTEKNDKDGTFNLLIRRGNDTGKDKVILEQYLNLSLDPFSKLYRTSNW